MSREPRVETRTLIRVDYIIGEGVPGDPIREVSTLYELDGTVVTTMDKWAERPVVGALERAANEGRNVLPDATDDQTSVIEQWALSALAQLKVD